ncbi:hypothetical protein STRIP9103_00975 [Streptomyces ipomoeae 91-03]|uniref:FAD/NAD(P)-binding domain-containing protein n=1 Tax=Streptomyces ipomoeae 91-03 TaxID=698759 RepID=L1KJ23_9ACTN|nr:hypothetical protein STRIP9103_00975 [Streptomyces ipomoeae 91-03]
MRGRAERFGAELIPEDIVSAGLSGELKTVTATAGTLHRAKAVIVATGSQHRNSACPTRTPSPAAGSPGAPPATASSSRTRTSP